MNSGQPQIESAAAAGSAGRTARGPPPGFPTTVPPARPIRPARSTRRSRRRTDRECRPCAGARSRAKIPSPAPGWRPPRSRQRFPQPTAPAALRASCPGRTVPRGTGYSLSGSRLAWSTLRSDFCVSGSNSRIDSTWSPNISIRTGLAASGEKTSRIPPRTENCPTMSTGSWRRYPTLTSPSSRSSWKNSSPTSIRQARFWSTLRGATRSSTLADRRHDHRGLALGDAPQSDASLFEDFGVRRKPVVRGHVVGGKHERRAAMAGRIQQLERRRRWTRRRLSAEELVAVRNRIGPVGPFVEQRSVKSLGVGL